MASHIGVTNLFSVAPPDGAVLERSERTRTCKAVKLEGTASSNHVVTVQATTEKYFTANVRFSGKGVVDFSTVTPGTIAAGTYKIISVRQGESNKDFPDFDQEALTYGNN